MPDFDSTIQSDTTRLTQSQHNCVDTWACRTASATSRLILLTICIQTPLQHNNTLAYLMVMTSQKLVKGKLYWALAGYENPKPLRE